MLETANDTPDFLNERSCTLLKKLIYLYIQTGQPVGSRTLSQDKQIDLSPASIRHVMASLEEQGFLASPHTSAGRVPTAQGYRFFVDTLLDVKPLAQQDTSRLKSQLLVNPDRVNVFNQVSTLLSDFTHLAGVVMLPRANSQQLQHIEFLVLSKKQVLVILVFNQQNVHNKIIDTEQNYSAAQLQAAANYLNQEFIGKDITQVLKSLKQNLKQACDQVTQWLDTALEVMDKTYAQAQSYHDDYVIAGATNLMDVAELSNLDTLRDLFVVFNQKQDILQLLEQSLNSQGVQVLIGEASGQFILDQCSIITAPYQIDNKVIGVVGVIGPTRMAYDRIIPVVDMTAQLLSASLSYPAKAVS